MTYLFLLLAFSLTDLFDIGQINDLKSKAETAYKSGKFVEAIKHYSFLIDTLHVNDDYASMNLANAYYHLGKKDLARSEYSKVALSTDTQLKSKALQQLGALSNEPATLSKALTYFKESIKADPTNEDARYNYELVKKKIADQKEQENQDKGDQNEDQEKQDQDQQDQNEQKKDGEKGDEQKNGEENKDEQSQDKKEGEDGEKKPSDEQQQEDAEKDDKTDDNKEQQSMPNTSDKLQKMNLTEEKAQMILEALRNNEVQYIQQNRRKATQPKDGSKPDW